jgi:hypothetical protein
MNNKTSLSRRNAGAAGLVLSTSHAAMRPENLSAVGITNSLRNPALEGAEELRAPALSE